MRLRETLFLILILASTLVWASTARATGGFSCRGETYSGKKVQISACVPHSILGLCSDLDIFVDDVKVLSVPKERVTGFYWGAIQEKENLLALKAYDADYNEEVVDLVYRYHVDDLFRIQSNYSHMQIRDGGTRFEFRDVLCEFE